MRSFKRHARTWFQAAFFALTNGYARGFTSGKIYTGNSKILCVPGLNCYSCPGALAACPIGSLQAVLNKSSFKISLYVFGLLSMFGVLFGRLVCGWMCPFGLVQDLLHKIKLGPKRKNLPGHHYLRYLRYVVLVVMVLLLPAVFVGASGVGQPWFCEWICPSGTLLGGIPLVAINAEFRSVIGLRFFWKLALLLVILLGSVVFYRPFCKYLCPLGAIYGLFNPVSTYRIEVDASKCVKCRACQRACGMDIATFQTPNSMDCIRCGDCVHACPTGALQTTWGKMGTRVASRCFIDDEPEVRSTGATRNLALSSTTLLGALLVVGGLFSAVSSAYFGLFKDFSSRMTIEQYSGLGPASLILGCMKVIASLIIFITGVYVLRYRNDAERSGTVTEKLALAHVVYLIGIVAAVAAVISELSVLGMLFNACIKSGYCLLCIPIVRLHASQVKKQMTGGERKSQATVIAVLACVFTVLGSLMEFVFVLAEFLT